METAAKQAGVFWQLRQLISLLAYSQRRTEGQFTPDEQRLEVDYRNAHYKAIEPFEGKVTGADKPKWFELRGKYERDLWLRDEVFKKYFTPELRRSFYVALKAEMPTQSAPPGSTLGPSAPTPAAAFDPAIAKARLSKVDTTIFGWQLGETLLLRPCPAIMLEVEENCFIKGPALGTDPDTGAERRIGGAVVRTVYLTRENCPSWVGGCRADILLRDGHLLGVFLYTSGRDVEKITNEELRAKYGQPSGAYVGRITPDVGNAFAVENPEWNLPGLHVEYQVIAVQDNGRINLNQGLVRIETESVYKLRMAAKDAPVKRKL